MPVIKRSIRISNKLGLHARASAKLTQLASKFQSGIWIERNGRRGDQYVEMHVEIPEKLTPEQEAAAKAFAEKTGMKH